MKEYKRMELVELIKSYELDLNNSDHKTKFLVEKRIKKLKKDLEKIDKDSNIPKEC